MAGRCQICDKKPSTGNTYTTRGLAKKTGGIGIKITGKTKRWFKPNLQKLKVIEENGHVHRVWICTRCIRNEKVTKAPNQTIAREVAAELKAVSKAK